MPAERCAWPRCRSREIELTYLGRPLCCKHWDRLCHLQDEGRGAEARRLIGLPATQPHVPPTSSVVHPPLEELT